MIESISIIVPAFRCKQTICRAIESVLAQTHESWELIVVADDHEDYESILGRRQLSDTRIKHLNTGHVGSGPSLPRNAGLDYASRSYCAILDADDTMHPFKLETAIAALQKHSLVSCAIDIRDSRGRLLRTVGTGPDRILDCATYKTINYSNDSILVYDCRSGDPR